MIKLIGYLAYIIDSIRIMWNFCFDKISCLSFYLVVECSIE